MGQRHKQIKKYNTSMGKQSAVGQPTRPTQPFILLGSIDE